jgi:hypothetical protein
MTDTGRRKPPVHEVFHPIPTQVVFVAPASQDAESLRRCMHDLGLRRGYLIYPGEDSYSLGEGITVLSAEELLSAPESLLKL